MKTTLLTLLFVTFYTHASASSLTCIDPALINMNAACPDVIDPVCGCDGNTYINDCEASSIYGVTSWTLGTCINSCDVSDLT